MLRTARIVSVFCCALLAWAQHEHHGPAAGGEKPAMLLPGMGKHTHKITTRSAEAQQFFDQGLNMLFGFNRYEALRSFRRSAELDPAAPMPQWGIAAALGPHINMDMDGDHDPKASCAAAMEAVKLSKRAPALEQAYATAAAARCPEYKPADYVSAMRDLMTRFPDDLDAATLFAEAVMIPVRWRWWGSDGTPAQGMEEAVSVLESVMRRNPNHPGANHFYIHAVEMSPSPERAVPSAQRLMGIVPGAGHLVHMPGHIWMILGDFDVVADTNERAVQVDREYFAKTGVQSGYAGYYLHNLHFIAVARQMQGKKAAALKAATEVASASAEHIEAMPSMADAFTAMPIYAMLRFQMWDEILGLKAPHPKLVGTEAVWRFARAVAFTAKDKPTESAAERKEFHAAKAKVPADWLWLNNKAPNVLNVFAAALEARVARSDREAIPHWERAVELESKLIYDEPPPFFYPLRESLGAALLRSGDAAAAERVFRDGIRRSPRNGRMLFGLHEALKAQKKMDAAESVQREFEAAWKKADVTLKVADL